jgi:hypothetical protein
MLSVIVSGMEGIPLIIRFEVGEAVSWANISWWLNNRKIKSLFMSALNERDNNRK